MIAATLHGPNYESSSPDEKSIEVFTHLEEAIRAMFRREAANGHYELEYITLDGVRHSTRFPTFDEGTRLECYEIDSDVHLDGLSIPPFEEFHAALIEKVLAQVHNGAHDWTLTIADDDGQTIVKVARS